MSLARILDAIPHRPPFLWIDEVLEETPERLRALKRVDPQEPCLRGHYPGFPLLPGVLVLEAIFQAGAVLLAERIQEAQSQGQIPVLARAREAKFKRMVRPGDRLEIEVRLVDSLGKAFKLSGEASVGGELAASVEYMVALVPAPQEAAPPAGESLTSTTTTTTTTPAPQPGDTTGRGASDPSPPEGADAHAG